MSEFRGFPPPEQNYSKLPHAFIDVLPLFESASELKVVLYILRHTWGFSEFDKPKHMTVDEIMNGRKRSDGTRLDAGTGLSKPSVISGCRAAEQHGFIEVEVDDHDSGRVKKSYRIRMDGSNIFTSGVKEVYPTGQTSLPRTEKETIERNQRKDSTAAKATEVRSAKEKKPREPDVIYDAITQHIYGGIEQPYRVGTLAHWMKGNVHGVTQNRKPCAVPVCDPPASIEEIAAFPRWMKDNHDAIEVKQPTVVVDYFLRMRNAQANAAPKQRIHMDLPPHLRAPTLDLDGAP